MKIATKRNMDLWNDVYKQFITASALPVWGPFGVGEDLHLIPMIKGKKFLEIGCGSGRSIKYLTDRGARKVYGLDFSKQQIEESRKHNSKAIKKGVVELIYAPMEEKIDIEPVDAVFSVYSIGWTQEPEKTFTNIYSYLKPGGMFIWSWDHTFFTNVSYDDGKFVVIYSYHDEKPLKLKDWKNIGKEAYITYRKTSTWFQLLITAKFEVVGYYEPKPVNLKRGYKDPKMYYSVQKAKKVPATYIFVCRKN